MSHLNLSFVLLTRVIFFLVVLWGFGSSSRRCPPKIFSSGPARGIVPFTCTRLQRLLKGWAEMQLIYPRRTSRWLQFLRWPQRPCSVFAYVQLYYACKCVVHVLNTCHPYHSRPRLVAIFKVESKELELDLELSHTFYNTCSAYICAYVYACICRYI